MFPKFERTRSSHGTNAKGAPLAMMLRVRRALSLLLCLCMLLGMLPAAFALEDEGVEPYEAGEHIAALTYPLVEGFDSTNWSAGSGFQFDETSKSYSFNGSGPNNTITYTGTEGKIKADSFLIQFDLTPKMEASAAKNDVKVRFNINDQDQFIQVRFSFDNKIVCVGGFTGATNNTADWGNAKNADLNWTKDTAIKVDIKVETGKVSFSLDGGSFVEVSIPEQWRLPQGGFAFASQWGNQNYTLSNLKITTDEAQTQEKVATPEISEADTDGKVTISCDTEGASIYYTTDGSDPTAESTKYTAPFTLTANATVKAIAVKDGMTNSEVAEKTITISGSGGDEPTPETKHLNPLQYTLIDGGLGDESKWDVLKTDNSTGTYTFDSTADSASYTGMGKNNEIVYKDGAIDTPDFLIQFDIRMPNKAGAAEDFKVRMKENNEKLLQILFKFNSNWVALEGLTKGNDGAGSNAWGGSNADGYRASFTWEAGRTYPVDIQVEGKKVTVYWNGGKVLETEHNDVEAMVPSALSFASQFDDQDHTISNLKVTSNTDPKAEPTRVATPEISAEDGTVTLACDTEGATIYYTTDGTDPTTSSTEYKAPFTLTATATVKAIAVKEGLTKSAVAEKEVVVANKDVVHKFEPLSRVLLPASALDNAESWDLNNSNVTISNGEATIKGAGPLNRMGYKLGRINANNFLIRLDFTPNEGNTNSNTKIAFKCTDQYEGNRLQLRLDCPHNKIYLERTSNNSAPDNNNPDWSVEASYTFKKGLTYGIDIEVKDKTINVYINGGDTPAITTTKDDIASMAKGYFAIAGQFPYQDFTIKNLSITTGEQQTGEQYTVTLKTYTDGVEGSDGGTVTADTLTGYAGDLITLTPSPAHGYVLEKYTSYKADGSSTDGLMPVTDNKFTLDAKFGNVTVIAHFVKRTPGKFELFYDDFAADSLDGSYQVKATDKITQNGVVTIGATDTNYMILDQAIFTPVKVGEGLRISVDAWKGNSTNGTMQIMFKGSSFDDRYVLVLNGSEVAVRHIVVGGANTKLTQASYTFGTAKAKLVLEVQGDTAVFLANGKEILRYTSTDNWGGLPNAAGLVNMTSGALVCFDDFLVERIPEQIDVVVKSYILSGGAENEDSANTAGVASSGAAKVVPGDVVALTAVAKPGYELLRYTVTDGADKSITVTDGAFTVPDDTVSPITVKAVFQQAGVRAARAFFIDSQGGSDSGDGTQSNPWKSLDKLAEYTQTSPLVPGDQIKLKRGSVFDGQQLRFSGMGSKSAPVVVSAYGEGSDLPRLNGGGTVENVVSLYNQEYITLSELEITNTDPNYSSAFTLNGSNNKAKALRAINVSAKDFGVVSGITIRDCYIHDINGNINLKWNGGVFFDVQVTVDPTSFTLTGVPTKYDNVLIENCTFINVDRSGIKLVSSGWCNQWLKNDGTKPINWYPSTNVVVRNNYMEKIGGDGITTRDTDGALVEYNLVKDCRYQQTAYNVGIWPFQAANTVIQYNEAYNTHSTQDGQGLDCDHASAYSLMQYNYSHNNEGGFMLIMGGYPHTAPTVRYNISQNDYDKTFEFAQGLPMGTMIYNNTFYSKDGAGRGIFFLSNTANGRGINDFYAFNNLFVYPAGQTIYGSMAAELKQHAKLYNNGYVGLTAPTEEGKAITASDAADVLMNAGSGPETNDTKVPVNGKSDALAGYQLKTGSPMIDRGITLAQAIEHFGGAGFQVFDGRDKSPNELETLYYGKRESSLKYVMGENFPRVSGVDYTLDFFGSPNVQNGTPDIGAAEFLDHEHTGGKATCVAGAVCTICNKHYGPLDPENHTGNTEVRGAYPATSSQPGYTGDTYCADCGVLLEEGSEIPASGGGSSSGGSSSGGSTVKVPVSGDENSVQVSASVSGSTATISKIDTERLSTVVGEDVNTGMVEIDLSGLNRTIKTVNLPANAIQEIAKAVNDTGNDAKGLTIKLSTAEVSFDAAALDEIQEQAAGQVTLTVAPAKSSSLNERQKKAVGSSPVFDLTMRSGAKDITSFGGGYVTVSLSHKLEPGQDPAGIVVYYLDSVGNIHACETMYDVRTETVLFTTNHLSLYYIGYAPELIGENPFSDVSSTAYYYNAVRWAAAKGITAGTSAITFSPNASCTRAQMAVFLWRAAGSPEPRSAETPFVDVRPDAYYAKAVLWAAEQGITSGTSATTFSPDAVITRAQAVTFLYQAAGTPAVKGENPFEDVASDAYYATAVLWAAAEGITAGTSDTAFSPDTACTRAQIVTFLYRSKG